MILEDPDGTRLLYDSGRTVAGAEDPRLGKIDVVLVSHMHGDHVGDRHLKQVNGGECGKPDVSTVVAAPNTNSVNIALAKKAKTQSPAARCRASLPASCKALGGDPKRLAARAFRRFAQGRRGLHHHRARMYIRTVSAGHSSAVRSATCSTPAGLTAYAGPPTGYVLTFSNGLVVYLSGDTGITAEQDSVVRRHYRAKLVVMNIGDTFTTGPKEAAFVINDLVKPNAVIASHANEVATQGGRVIAGTKTDTFIKATKVPVHLPLSGRTMAFDANGKCVSGC